MYWYQKARKVKGIIQISVEGFFIERFINLCLQENLEIWNIEYVNEGKALVQISPIIYDKILEVAQITKCKIEIVEKTGIPFMLNRYKHRKIFAALIAIISTIITIINLFIWKVEIKGDFSIPIAEINRLLEEENIRLGGLKKEVDIDSAKLNILLKRDDIAWVGINIKGNKVTVEVVEKELVEEDIFKGTIGNIVADKAGIVEKIYVAAGIPMVKKGELIDKGCLLISGIISNNEDEQNYVRAEGEILLKTTYIEKSKIPLKKDLVIKTGNIEKTYKMKFNNYLINLPNKVTNFEKYDTITREKVFSIFGVYDTPISLVETHLQEIKIETVQYTEKQAEDLGIISNNEKLKEKIPNTAEKINYYNKVWKNEEYLEVETVVQCYEKTGTYEKIEGN